MLKYGFFDSIKGDRRYNSKDVAELFDGIIVDGIYAQLYERFSVDPKRVIETEEDKMTVTVGTGQAWLNHTKILNTSKLELVLSEAIGVDRYDAIIIEVNDNKRNVDIFVKTNVQTKTGNAATAFDLVDGQLINTEFVHQHLLAVILVEGGSTHITAGNIASKVGYDFPDGIPYVTCPLEPFPADETLKQWGAQWYAFINSSDVEFQYAQQVRDEAFTTAQNERSSDFSTFMTESNEAFTTAQNERNTDYQALRESIVNWINSTETDWNSWYSSIKDDFEGYVDNKVDPLSELIQTLTARLNAVADSDDETLDQLSEIVSYIKANRTLIDNLTEGGSLSGFTSLTDVGFNLDEILNDPNLIFSYPNGVYGNSSTMFDAAPNYRGVIAIPIKRKTAPTTYDSIIGIVIAFSSSQASFAIRYYFDGWIGNWNYFSNSYLPLKGGHLEAFSGDTVLEICTREEGTKSILKVFHGQNDSTANSISMVSSENEIGIYNYNKEKWLLKVNEEEQISSDYNYVTPIHNGGTGGSNARDAFKNLYDASPLTQNISDGHTMIVSATGSQPVRKSLTDLFTYIKSKLASETSQINIGTSAHGKPMARLFPNGNINQPYGYFTGEADPTDATVKNHAMKLGHGGDDKMNFYEYGGVFNFYKSRSNVDTLLGSIDADGWKGRFYGHTKEEVLNNDLYYHSYAYGVNVGYEEGDTVEIEPERQGLLTWASYSISSGVVASSGLRYFSTNLNYNGNAGIKFVTWGSSGSPAPNITISGASFTIKSGGDSVFLNYSVYLFL